MKKTISNKLLIKMYSDMVLSRTIEERMLLALRQGKLSKWFSGIFGYQTKLLSKHWRYVFLFVLVLLVQNGVLDYQSFFEPFVQDLDFHTIGVIGQEILEMFHRL